MKERRRGKARGRGRQKRGGRVQTGRERMAGMERDIVLVARMTCQTQKLSHIA